MIINLKIRNIIKKITFLFIFIALAVTGVKSQIHYVGELYGGGMIVQTDGNSGLIVTLYDVVNNPGRAWGCDNICTNATSETDGQANVALIFAAGCSPTAPAAYLCDTLQLNGYNDWYLPAIDQLDSVWTQHLNFPDYDPGNCYWYWSSTEYCFAPYTYHAYQLEFCGHVINHGGRSGLDAVRCVRNFDSGSPSCNLSLNPGSANVSNSSGSTTFLVTANLTWTISESCSWLTVSPSGGSGNTTVTINYNANTVPGSRSCVLTVSCGSSTQYFTITQAGTAPAGPCDGIISINNCGSAYQQTYTGGGTGVWNTYFCAYSTPGLEQVYSFVAPATGIYSIQVTSASGYVDYGWMTGSCAETGWTCIDDIASTGTYGSLSWNAGTTYYLLLDDEDNASGTHQFYINCTAPPACSLSLSPASVNVSSSSGSTTFSVTANAAWTLSESCSWLTASPSSGSGNSTVTINYDANTSLSRNCTLTVSCGSSTQYFTITQAGTAPANPCNSAVSIAGYGSAYQQTYTGGGTGVWNTNFCAYSTPGLEQVYSFVAPATGIYSISVTSASGYVDYGWKSGSCAETGWTCIDDITSTGTFGSFSWNAGTTYYLLLDDENSTSGTHQFYLNCTITGIANNSSFAGQLVFYPNPLTDQLYIELPENNLVISEVEIFNTLGEVIFSGWMKNKLQIDFSRFESGIYYLKVKTQKISEIKKVIKL